ncbi:MAG: DUF2207 domain-containing protein [Phycisphaerales bacterium]|nr:DUF2207 domain-containing protein [Phycisphaerales bacterium]
MSPIRRITATLTALMVVATANGEGALSFDRIAVRMDVQTDGRIRVTETWDCVLDGPLNGGYRNMPLRGVASVSDISLREVPVADPHDIQPEKETPDAAKPIDYAVVEGSEKDDIPLHKCRVVKGLSETRLRWRSRAPAAPPYENQQARFVLSYTLNGSIRKGLFSDGVFWKAIFADRISAVKEGACDVHLPCALDNVDVTFFCTAPDAKWEEDADARTIHFSASNIPPQQDFEIFVRFPKEVIKAPLTVNGFFDGAGGVIVLLLAAPVIVLLNWLRWFRFGRDPAPTAALGPATSPPDELPPAIVGALLNESTDMRSVIATLLDLGRRGVLELRQLDDDFEIVLASKGDASLRPFELNLLNGLFGRGRHAGETIRVSELKNRFYKTANSIKRAIWSETQEKYFDKGPQHSVGRNALMGLAWLVPGLILIGVSSPTTAFLFVWGAFFAGIPTVMAAAAWQARSWAGVAVFVFVTPFILIGLGGICWGYVEMWSGWAPVAHVPGFALFCAGLMRILLSGAMRRKTQLGADIAARWRAFREHLRGLDERTPEPDQFGDFLPYAIALNAQSQWMRRFSSDAVRTSYYHPSHDVTAGGSGGFDFGKSVSTMVSSISATLASSPSGSGSSGGGSSGGGGGGGGGSGGGW